MKLLLMHFREPLKTHLFHANFILQTATTLESKGFVKMGFLKISSK